MLKKSLFLLVFICHNNLVANDKIASNLSYNENDPTNPIKKTTTENDWKHKVDYYRTKMFQSDKKLLLLYADSLLTAALNSKNKDLIGNAYLTKGIVYYNQKQLQKALDNYIVADEYIAQTNDQYAIYKVKYSIAHTKYYLGFYEEAIALFKECLSYFEEENDRAYLNSIHSLGLCYNKTNRYDLCSYYNNLGLREGIELNNSEMIPYFNHSEGVNQFFKKNYTNSIKKLTEVLPALKRKNDFANETVAYFYIGKSYQDSNQENKAIPFFLQVDKAFIEKQYIRPDLRENYEILINYFKKQKNQNKQLEYINKLLKVDSILDQNYKYLSQKVNKEYDTKKLLLEKKEIEDSLKVTSKASFFFIASLVAALVILLLIQHRNKKKYRAKFEELMRSKSTPTQKPSINKIAIDVDINPELIASVMQNLEKFEKNLKFLEKDMNLTKLAALLKTNPKYAAKIILKYRGKKTIEYISDLKIDYIIELLKTENKYRLYTNKALGEEAGFGSTQNFTKAFKTKTGIAPTYFILELNKIT